MQHSLVGCSVAHGGAAYLSRVQLSPLEKYIPQAARVWAEGRHFVSGNSLFLFGGEAKLRWTGGARAGRGNELKRRVRAAHGRARAAKTH
jgi:hypothetical protein